MPTKNITYGVDAWKPKRNQTLTADVVAGSEVGVRMMTSHLSDGQVKRIFHIGPAQAYLAKAPDDIKDLSAWDPTDADWYV